jgi:hypothetical protein
VEAPDFVAPITGWRLWRISERRRQSRLRSLFLDDVWPWLEPLEARCAIPRLAWRRLRAPHPAPDGDCDCGIYATLWSTVASQLGRSKWGRRPDFVVGEVALWGTVVEAELGWRSAYAYPQRMFVLVPRRADVFETVRVTTDLERYGVPVEPIEMCAHPTAAAAIEARVSAAA